MCFPTYALSCGALGDGTDMYTTCKYYILRGNTCATDRDELGISDDNDNDDDHDNDNDIVIIDNDDNRHQ